jgi:hypothetical protein
MHACTAAACAARQADEVARLAIWLVTVGASAAVPSALPRCGMQARAPDTRQRRPGDEERRKGTGQRTGPTGVPNPCPLLGASVRNLILTAFNHEVPFSDYIL